MSIIIHLQQEDNSLLFTESDIGRGFGYDEKDGSCKKNRVFIHDEKDITTTYSQTDSSNLSIIKDEESLKSVLNFNGDSGLAISIINGKIIGKHYDFDKADSKKLILLFNRKIVSKVAELKPNAKLLGDVELEDDIDSLRSGYGLFYIKKIEYGAFLNIIITLESNDEKSLAEITSKLQGSINIGKLSSVLDSYKDNSNTNSKINVTSSIFMSGCNQVASSNAQSYNETINIINSFQVDKGSLIPVKIEISPIPITRNFIIFDTQSFDNYKKKISLISTYHLELQKVLEQLSTFMTSISHNNDNDNYSKVCRSTLTDSIQKSIRPCIYKAQEELYKFIHTKMDYILNNELPYTSQDIYEIRIRAQKLMGLTFTKTPRGNWFGSSIKELPINEGTYEYNNGSIFKGQCLNGKRHGNGVMTFVSGNIDKLESISGHWKDDEPYIPITIAFNDNKTPPIVVTNLPDCNIYKHKFKNSIMCKNREAVKVDDHSTSDEYRYRITVNVELIQDEQFSKFYQSLQNAIDECKRIYFMFLGMTGTGKTTLIEFILNVLTGQINSPTTLRAESLEDEGIGESKTKSVCRYEVEYILNGGWMFGITIIDTPGFADVKGLERDREHISSILKTVGKLERIDSISYVVSAALTRTTLEPLKVLCNVFSILPNEAFDCISTFISFCDNSNQANDVRNILDKMLKGIKERPAVYIDNPWAQHLNNTFRSSHDTPDAAAGTLLGVDNTDELQSKLKAKTQIIQQFIIERIRSKSSFKPAGMEVLHQLKDELLLKLKNLAVTVQDLSTTTNLYKELTSVKINNILERLKTISIEDWLKDKGYALIDGTPKAKIMGTTPWPGGHHSTVCYAPQCLNMVCHQACSIKFTHTRGDNIFINCLAFNKNENCKVCSSKCSYKQHVHAQFQLEWVENDSVLEAYYSIKMGAGQALKKSKDLEHKALDLKLKYSKELEEFSKLKNKFKDLSVLGDMRIILDSTKRTYEQQYEIAIQIEDQEKADNLQKIIDQLKSFIEALDATEKDETSFIQQFNSMVIKSSEIFKQLKDIL